MTPSHRRGIAALSILLLSTACTSTPETDAESSPLGSSVFPSATDAPPATTSTATGTPSRSVDSPTSGTSSSVPTTSPDPSSTPESAPQDVPTLSADLAVEVAEEALGAAAQVFQSPEGSPALDPVMTGTFLSSVLAQQEQWAAESLRQVGSVVLEDVRIIEQRDDGSALVQACVDSSDVQVLDENGVDLRGPGTPDRTSTIFTLVPGEGRWLVSDQTFADPPDC